MAINPFPDATLLPVLRPQKWDGGEPALRSKLIRTEEPLQHNLWVSFAYSTESKLYTVTKDSLSAHGQTGKAVVMEALKNLDEQNFEWEISSRRADGSAGKFEVVRSPGSEHTVSVLVECYEIILEMCWAILVHLLVSLGITLRFCFVNCGSLWGAL